ncbi:MAG: aminopeptidase, partial [Clostridia bacterium]|nr:aminopeptidase [Clostridia bacterium]
MKNATPISCCELAAFNAYHADDAVRQAMTSVFSKTGMGAMTFLTDKAKKMQFFFNHEVKTMGATNQKSSGRCWLFAATNVLREQIGKKLNVDSFELSQSYLAFWDKFERVNYYIEAIADTANEPSNSRVVDYIVETGVHDGGQWDMFVNIVKKYGVVPKVAYPETFQSSNTGTLNRHINNYLRAKTGTIRTLVREGRCEEFAALRTEILKRVYSFLCACYDVPPAEFDFEYKDKDGAIHLERGLTPMSFCEKYVGNYLDDYVSIVHAPTADKPFGKMYTVKYLGNVVGGEPVKHLNLEMDEFKALAAEQ